MRFSMAAALLVASSMLAATAVQAQEMDLMQFADADKDGKVTPTEYAAFLEQAWGYFSQGSEKVKVADLDDQGKGAFTGVTPDAEGYVSKATYLAAAPTRFKAADKNGDGTLDSTELNASMKPAG